MGRIRALEAHSLTFLSLFIPLFGAISSATRPRLDWSRDVSPRYFFPSNRRYTCDEVRVSVDFYSFRSIGFLLPSTLRGEKGGIERATKKSGAFTPLRVSGCTCVAVGGFRRSSIINVPGEPSRSAEIDLPRRVSREGQVHRKRDHICRLYSVRVLTGARVCALIRICRR